jgi:hypothetical protein
VEIISSDDVMIGAVILRRVEERIERSAGAADFDPASAAAVGTSGAID